jgi:hypothetical protein
MSKHEMIAELAKSGMTKREAFSELRLLVESQTEPMVFKANVPGGRRMPKPISEQLVELKNQIGRSYKQEGRAKTAEFESEEIPTQEEIPTPEETHLPEPETAEENSEIPADACDSCGKTGVELFHDEESGQSLCEDCLPVAEETPEKPQAKGKKRILSELEYFEKRKNEISDFCKRREEMSTESVDDLDTVRPEEAAAKLIPAGVPADALLSTMTMHWPTDARSDAGIPEFDFVSLSREIMEARGIHGVNGETAHELFGWVLTLAEARQPIWLIGPKGTGKSHLCRQLSVYLDLPYGEAPMTPGATRGDLLGRPTIAGLDSVIAAAALHDAAHLQRILDSGGAGFILAKFVEIYANGGIFNFEEIDAADASMLIVLNNALAGEWLSNTANGVEYKRSTDFVAMATGNTFGLGANRKYVGRERLDDATLDRWRMGRVFLHRDPKIAASILRNHV